MTSVCQNSVYSPKVAQSFMDCYVYAQKGLNMPYYDGLQNVPLCEALSWKAACIHQMGRLQEQLIATLRYITTQEDIKAITTRLIELLTTLMEDCAIYKSSAWTSMNLAGIQCISSTSFKTNRTDSASWNSNFCCTYKQFKERYTPIVVEILKIHKQYEWFKPKDSLEKESYS